jgi:serine/threonine-protein kinase SRPK3
LRQRNRGERERGGGKLSKKKRKRREQDFKEEKKKKRKGDYHAVRIRDRFSAGRYVAQRKLGWGNFSTVWLAYDTLCSVSSSNLWFSNFFL